MYNRPISFIEKMDIIYAKQFGFRSHHSTEHATLSIVDKIHEGIEKGMFSCGIFLDFSKAFDTVNHSILIRKLEHYGVRGIAKDWFVSYLSNRRSTIYIYRSHKLGGSANFMRCTSGFNPGTSPVLDLY